MLEYCTSERVSFVVQICTGISGVAISRVLFLPIADERLWKQGFAKQYIIKRWDAIKRSFAWKQCDYLSSSETNSLHKSN